MPSLVAFSICAGINVELPTGRRETEDPAIEGVPDQ
jgi:hypothetical protein